VSDQYGLIWSQDFMRIPGLQTGRRCRWHAGGVKDHRDGVPGYRTVRVGVPEEPVAAMADEEAWQARSAYPDLRFAGPLFGVAREREQGGWELHRYFGVLVPQDARDSMGAHFRRLAETLALPGERGGREECLQAAGRLDCESIDEVTVLGVRYRVVRADRFVHSGPAGPEPPRPSDPDPGKPGQAGPVPDPAEGFVVDPATATGISGGLLKLELLEALYPADAVPPQVRDDCVRALGTHPGGVLLPPAFTTAELCGGRWKPMQAGTSPTPQDARDTLALYLRVMAPWELNLGQPERAVYAAAAERLDAGRLDDVEVSGRRFRVVRVERLMRIGPDGPEGPRPSDPDSEPPGSPQAQLSREQGGVSGEDEDTPAALNEDTQRLARLFQEEEERRKAR